MHQSSILANFVEHDGCARMTIVVLFVTAVGCLAYTWGYYEGINNAKPLLLPDSTELGALSHKAHHNETVARSHSVHGLGGHAVGAHGAKDKLHGTTGEKRPVFAHGRRTQSQVDLAVVPKKVAISEKRSQTETRRQYQHLL